MGWGIVRGFGIGVKRNTRSKRLWPCTQDVIYVQVSICILKIKEWNKNGTIEIEAYS